MSAIIDGLSALDPVFTFMLVLPFLVAAAGLLSEHHRGAHLKSGSFKHPGPKMPSALREFRASL